MSTPIVTVSALAAVTLFMIVSLLTVNTSNSTPELAVAAQTTTVNS